MRMAFAVNRIWRVVAAMSVLAIAPHELWGQSPSDSPEPWPSAASQPADVAGRDHAGNQAEASADAPATQAVIEPDGLANSRARQSAPSLLPPAPGTHPADALFPATLRPLQPYLQMANRFGTKALKPGAIITASPLAGPAQAIKTELAKIGLRYSFDQALIYASISDRAQGAPNVGAYSYGFFGNWNIFEADELGGTAGWLSLKFVGGTGIGDDWLVQNPSKNVGTISKPNNNYHSKDFAVEQVAWGQAFNDGEVVLLAGMINQTNTLDINRYANSGHGQFLNASLVNSLVLPAPGNNLGINAQWQPRDDFYAMLGVAANNQSLGQSPFSDLSWDSVSYLAEFGWIVDDLCGLGPGTYRLQPFAATYGGDWGGGFGVNIEQQLGAHSPLGTFARFGLADDVVAAGNGVKMQASAGLAMLAPFGDRGFFSAHNDNFLGVGFVWTQAPDDAGFIHRNEYALELTAAIQLSPTITIQPDVQLIWDAANNPSSGPSVVFQMQLNIAW